MWVSSDSDLLYSSLSVKQTHNKNQNGQKFPFPKSRPETIKLLFIWWLELESYSPKHILNIYFMPILCSMSQIVETLLAWSVRRQNSLTPEVALLPKAGAALPCCGSKTAEDPLFELQIMHKNWSELHGFSDAQRWEWMAGTGCGAVCWGYSMLLQALSGYVEWCLLSRKRCDLLFLT